MAEQVAVDQLAWNGGAVERQPRPLVPRRRLMHGAGEQLLADTGFAGDEHGDVRGGDAPRGLDQVGHRIRGVDEAELLLGSRLWPEIRLFALPLARVGQNQGRPD